MTGLVIIAIFTATATSTINISVDGRAVMQGKEVLRGYLHNFPKYRSPISLYEGFTLFFVCLFVLFCFFKICFMRILKLKFVTAKKMSTAYPRLRFFSKQIFTR